MNLLGSNSNIVCSFDHVKAQDTYLTIFRPPFLFSVPKAKILGSISTSTRLAISPRLVSSLGAISLFDELWLCTMRNARHTSIPMLEKGYASSILVATSSNLVTTHAAKKQRWSLPLPSLASRLLAFAAFWASFGHPFPHFSP
jgi:hypothetical protein